MADVTFVRGASSDIADKPVTDGQILFDKDNDKLYIDEGTTRHEIGSGSNISLPLSVENGGTGSTTANAAWTALGGGDIGKKSSLAASDIPSLDATKIGSGTLSSDRLPTIPIVKGGTNATTAEDARTNLGITPANIGAAASSHTHAATDIVSGNLYISRGGTGAGDIATARNNFYLGNVQLGSAAKQSVECTMTGNSGVLFIQRDNTKAIVELDLWTASAAVFGELPSNIVLVRGATSGTSGLWTVQNTGSSAIVLNAIGMKFGTVTDNDSAMTENITRVQIDALASHTHSYLPLSGGTLTGNVISTSGGLNLKSTNIDEDTIPASELQGSTILAFSDKDGALLGTIVSKRYTDGRQGLRIQSRQTVNGANVWNYLDLAVASDGTKYVTVSDTASWRRALGIGSSTGAFPITAAQGGTGRTTLTSNAIIAGNGTGQVKQITTASGALFATAANGAASFGTLPVAQGGTGGTTAAAALKNIGAGFTTKALSVSTTIAANSYTAVNFSDMADSGYRPFAVIRMNPGSNAVVITSWILVPSSDAFTVGLRNVTSSSVTTTVEITFIEIPA